MAAPTRIEVVGRFLANLIETEQLSIVLVDPDGAQHSFFPSDAIQPDGLLPVFLEAAEAVWEDATSAGFGVVIEEDNAAFCGFRVEDMADVPFSVVALTMLHAIEEARDGDVLRVNAMAHNAVQARLRARYRDEGPAAAPDPHPGPTP